MKATTDVFLITGFLGSGKTTFLKRIIHAFPPNQKLMILMNEFGDMGLDGKLVDSEDLAMLEISKGSIFCVCVKTDFIKGLMDIAQNIKPDVLLIEATGVANPTDLKRDLGLSIFHNRFRFREQFCLIDAVNFEDAYDTFTSVEKQIESATVFIINKIDEADEKVVSKVKEIVHRHHPDPVFHETTFADIPFGNYLSVSDHGPEEEGKETEAVTSEILETYIEDLLADPDYSMTPPDLLMSSILEWSARNVEELKKMTAKIPTGITRAKGVFRTGEDLYLFNWVMGKKTLTKISQKPGMVPLINRVVFIGSPEAMSQLERVDFKIG
ncbi:hypothetical protein KKI24_19985 [bacterium]|nr:hypothetical protein [bacterium]